MKNNNSEKTAEILLTIKAITFNSKEPYRYVSGILSPIYIDCRLLMSYPKERTLVRDMLVEEIKKTGKFNLIAGTATSGIPHAAWIAQQMELPMAYARSKPKDHGKGNVTEGIIKKKQRAAIIEDLISQGNSSIQTALAVRAAGAIVEHIFAIFTYGMQTSVENFANNNVQLHALSDYETAIRAAEKMGYIKTADKKMILEWSNDPKNWGRNMGFE